MISNMNKLEQSLIISHDHQYESIVAQIDLLDRQNKKLISIADNILKTSFLRTTDQKPTIITQFEEDMRNSFNALIEGIREFFISIDEKMERLSYIFENKFADGNLQKSKYPKKNTSAESDKIDMLMGRMNNLEQNLKKTQENEYKLISIIEAMTNKQNRFDQQPTMVRSRDKNYFFPKEEAKVEKSHQTSFRLFSMQDIHGGNPTLSEENHYNSPYHLINSQVSEKEKEKTFDRQQTYKFNNFCMPKRQESKTQINRNFLINRKDFEMQNSNRIHRLSNLMKGLKE